MFGKKSGRLVMGYQLPIGKIRNTDSDHAVLGGWMTQDAWDKVKYGRHEELSSDEKQSFIRWRENYQKSDSLKKQSEKDEKDLLDWIRKKLASDPNGVSPGTTQTRDAISDFGLQCFLLAMLPNLTRKPTWMSFQEWAETEVGLDSIHDLYPAITIEGRFFLLRDLIFNFGYGPNYFNWAGEKPFKLKGTTTTLYLVCMDVGKIANRESAFIWKIGITQKNVIGGSAKDSRFHGKVGENVRVVRQKIYKDGRDAYMIEQMMIKMSRQEASRYHQKEGYPAKTKYFEAFECLDNRTRNSVGYSEWIFHHKSEDEVISIFTRMTSYGEFHGDGNIAYTLFKRDFEKS